jgi:SAM-dependent methyltransferase
VDRRASRVGSAFVLALPGRNRRLYLSQRPGRRALTERHGAGDREVPIDNDVYNREGEGWWEEDNPLILLWCRSRLHITTPLSGLDVDYQVGFGERLPVATGEFDLAYCCDVLEHVSDLDAVISEIARALKQGAFPVRHRQSNVGEQTACDQGGAGVALEPLHRRNRSRMGHVHQARRIGLHPWPTRVADRRDGRTWTEVEKIPRATELHQGEQRKDLVRGAEPRILAAGRC